MAINNRQLIICEPSEALTGIWVNPVADNEELKEAWFDITSTLKTHILQSSKEKPDKPQISQELSDELVSHESICGQKGSESEGIHRKIL